MADLTTPVVPLAVTAARGKTYHGKPCRLGHGTERRAHRGECVVCHRESNRIYQARRAMSVAYRRKKQEDERVRVTGMTSQEFAERLVAQAGLCGICEEPMTGKGDPNADHCHAGGFPRGLLCANCNRGLGLFQDDPVRLANAIQYLKEATK